MRDFEIIVAVDSKGGIGKNGNLPWNLPEDLKHFKTITTKVNDPRKQNAVIMGRRTWESLPRKFRPLPDRINVVLTTQNNFPLPEGVIRMNDFKLALKELKQPEKLEKIEKVFVIGGGEVFHQAINLAECKTIHLTQVLEDFHCDVFFPLDPTKFKKIATSPRQRHGDLEFEFIEMMAV